MLTESETELIEHLDFEPGCEARHAHSECSQTVLWLATGCKYSLLICENGRQNQLKHMDRGVHCKDCFQLAADCWKHIPVGDA